MDKTLVIPMILYHLHVNIDVLHRYWRGILVGKMRSATSQTAPLSDIKSEIKFTRALREIFGVLAGC